VARQKHHAEPALAQFPFYFVIGNVNPMPSKEFQQRPGWIHGDLLALIATLRTGLYFVRKRLSIKPLGDRETTPARALCLAAKFLDTRVMSSLAVRTSEANQIGHA